ncbi:MAG: type IV pilus biogenesis/stability protein PilW [Pseudomonadota bacterium]|jgi:type IV pilus assembly protein PilF|uniref:type IV pilus biogenesis/stability protein PilW n=1 Tax=Marisediminitalea TaxID=2662254 RepID=UPI0020CD761B|nr:type IV pilus biogenesis/stability protein PilW [Marisediminitalea aggregata]MCP9478293.1 type IV pilus biogenesis/stability protein PilW [Marisediminitalea aggregata]MEC8229156.1 type IV pilus biogenesis/stability protein PilW [Pseudomonadota bacterium]
MLVTLLWLSGCVSENQGGNFSAEFDQNEAAKTRISLGLTYLKNGNYTQAKMNLDKALSFAPRLADSHYGLAYYYQVVGEVERAREAYETAMSLAPRNADIANSYGAFLCQQGDYEEAKTFFLQAVNSKQYANSAATYENMALCAQSQGQGEDAIEYLNSALKHQPGRAKTLFILTEMYVATEQYDLAEQTLRKYEKVARVSPDSLWMAIEIATGKGDILTANGYGDMLLTMYPDSPLTKLYIDRQQKLPQPVIKVKTKPQQSVKPDTVSVADLQASTESSNAVTTPAAENTVAKPESADSQPAVVTDNANETDTNTDDAAVAESVAEDAVAAEPVKFHIVQPKENLYRLSLKYNIKLDTLKAWNNLDNNGSIKIGTKLWLVPPAEQTQ